MTDSSEVRKGRPANELRLLHRASCEINASLEVDQVLESTMRSLDELFGLHSASAFLLDDREDLVLAARRGEGARERRRRLRIGQGMVGRAAGTRELIRLNFARPGGADGEVESHLAVPMLAKDVLVGVLSARAVADRVVRKSDETLIGIIANQAAVALQTARLYERLQRLNEELEERVMARTGELEAANRELRDAQAQLVQSGKLAALGQLAAGLAHEMNTPLGAIRSSTDVARRALDRIRDKSADSDHTLARAFGVIDSSHEVITKACGRLFATFATLRSFAKLDEAALQWMDLHAGLDTAVSLLPHLLGDRVAIVRDYGEVPPVRCYAGEINQVLLMVLTNAIEAIHDRGTITLQTRATPSDTIVEIADDGCGIEPAHRERIFDPGFTTKGVGVGAGLSLAIAYRIMEKHGGDISVESTHGAGTRVSLRLPMASLPPSSKAPTPSP